MIFIATTWFKSIHRTPSNSVSAALKQSIEYAMNPEKTDGGELIAAYECDEHTAMSDFLLSKARYEKITGRNQGKNDVIAYQIRQSFAHGEVTAEEALKLGHELVLRWTKGKHQFIVCAHNNTANPHTHIVFNSVNLDNNRKFKDFKRSAIALRRVSDLICLENGLSIIENPKLSKGYNHAEYLGDKKPPTVREKLKELIDNYIADCKSWEQFLERMLGVCDVKKGKHLAFKIPDSKKFIRLNSLGEGYSETDLQERLSDKYIASDSTQLSYPTASKIKSVNAEHEPSLMVDIQKAMCEGKGEGYRQWATLQNIKQMSKNLMFMSDNGIDSYDELVAKSAEASSAYNERLGKIRAAEQQLKDIAELQKQIANYSKTKDCYKAYLASGRNPDFYENHRAAVTIHEAAKRYFDSLGKSKIPSINQLKQEYAEVLAEKRELYKDYKILKENRDKLITAKVNSQKILGLSQDERDRDNQHDRYTSVR